MPSTLLKFGNALKRANEFMDVSKRNSALKTLCDAIRAKRDGLADTFLNRLVCHLAPIFDGFMLATPKRRTPRKDIWSRRYGNDNWVEGTKLFKPKRNIITCMECGNFHEAHAICRSCFTKVQEKSLIDKDLYKSENASTPVETKTNRPLWYVSNLSQKSARVEKLSNSTPKESENLTVRQLEENNKK